jgi:hypothetical protein
MRTQGSGVPFSYSRWLRCLLAVSAIASATGCADLKAIQAFGKMAPDPSVIQGLTKVYAQEPDAREDIKLLSDDAPNPDLATIDKSRTDQAAAIQKLDGVLRDYMQALVAVAGSNVAQSGSSVKDVTSGLTSLQKSMPTLGITGGQVTLIGNLVQSIADIAEAGYRNAKLVDIIQNSDASFHELLSVQTTIVSRGIRPSIVAFQRSLDDNGDQTIGRINEELKSWAAVPVCKLQPQKSEAPPKAYECREWNSKMQGESDARAARYLVQKSLESDRTMLATELATADAYTKSLDAIGKAHSKLVLSGKNVLTKETLQEIQPLATEVKQNYQDAQAVAVASPDRH